jgi:hypothetical protein
LKKYIPLLLLLSILLMGCQSNDSKASADSDSQKNEENTVELKTDDDNPLVGKEFKVKYNLLGVKDLKEYKKRGDSDQAIWDKVWAGEMSEEEANSEIEPTELNGEEFALVGIDTKFKILTVAEAQGIPSRLYKVEILEDIYELKADSEWWVPMNEAIPEQLELIE